MTHAEIIEDLEAKLKACRIEGEVFKMFKAKKHIEDSGGFDISAEDDVGTYRIAEFSECGIRDKSFSYGPESNREAFIAAFNAAPILLGNLRELAKKFVDMQAYAHFLEKKYNHKRIE